jgi:hypothetical protein
MRCTVGPYATSAQATVITYLGDGDQRMIVSSSLAGTSGSCNTWNIAEWAAVTRVSWRELVSNVGRDERF